MKESIYSLLNAVPVNATLDLTVPIWGVIAVLGSAVAAVVSLYISLVLLKERFEAMKLEIAKLRQENIDQSKIHTKELADIKEMIYQLLSPNTENSLRFKRTK
jgi:uncharacterized membrane protein (DUF106 family)